MAEVMIGIDPHKSSHTAVAISVGEEPLGELRVDAKRQPLDRKEPLGSPINARAGHTVAVLSRR
jgi:hypothetical protein